MAHPYFLTGKHIIHIHCIDQDTEKRKTNLANTFIYQWLIWSKHINSLHDKCIQCSNWWSLINEYLKYKNKTYRWSTGFAFFTTETEGLFLFHAGRWQTTARGQGRQLAHCWSHCRNIHTLRPKRLSLTTQFIDFFKLYKIIYLVIFLKL